MAEKFKLYKTIESFIDSKCSYKKNEEFIINYHYACEPSNNLPVLFEQNNYIQCVMSLPQNKEQLLSKNAKKDLKIKVIDSCYELVLYKSANAPNIIKCLLLLIVKDIEKEDKEPNKFNSKNLTDINNEYKLLEKLKKFIFDYIKQNKRAFNTKNNSSAGNLLEKILLGDSTNEIRFFNDKNLGINFEDSEIKSIINSIKSVSSKLEIKQKKNEADNKAEKGDSSNNNSNNDKAATPTDKKANKEVDSNANGNKTINDVLDDLNPDYKNDLINKYLDEMPEEINELNKKYRGILFTKEMYMNYISGKDNASPKANEDPKVDDDNANQDNK